MRLIVKNMGSVLGTEEFDEVWEAEELMCCQYGVKETEIVRVVPVIE